MRDEVAREFCSGKGGNQYAWFGAWTPNGEYLGETELYADKDMVFDYLVELLREHPVAGGVEHSMRTYAALRPRFEASDWTAVLKPPKGD
ncbi:MAG: hypothetical protein GY711_07785 [bacterium]|nr:hypothetical protein [bacterium]